MGKKKDPNVELYELYVEVLQELNKFPTLTGRDEVPKLVSVVDTLTWLLLDAGWMEHFTTITSIAKHKLYNSLYGNSYHDYPEVPPAMRYGR